MEQFWELADESKLNAQYSSDTKLEFLKHASAKEVRKICLQYRFFVHNYPNNLSTLVGKLPYGDLKTLLGQILAEELGSGKAKDAHIVWYDRFLRSIGVDEDALEHSLYPENAELLADIEEHSKTKSFEFVTGLVGMGAECLCQIYLTNMHKYIVQNDFIKELGDDVDWHFWDFHIGEEDIAHRLLVRNAINGMVMEPKSVLELSEGYEFAKKTWDEFWVNNYKETNAKKSI